ncbi:response regulator receiver modulated CheB methylesterase [Pirellula staleyi DSM 6068]|uniref:Protein-glutamate methylesterase/protein-glutamine glutaminase n=1 Tax=Pirellula staleyi (strain ATCC 27377 / DSM 6068 / ICPB 4128) TaxID=530564 RepID=D2R2Y2_PIRSD|nr:response regulator receiver modulated CheB methylesterase [Pirellula staleyi DSM 6068]
MDESIPPQAPHFADALPRKLTVPTSSIRVLVIDDSPLMRALITDAINAQPGIEVCGQAEDGEKGLVLFEKLMPDVVTLDIQMPKMDGLETLTAILAKRSVPVIMVSSLTQLGADVTLEALDRGAIDYVAKPDGQRAADQLLRDELIRKIRNVAGADLKKILEIRARRARMRQMRTPLSVLAPTSVAMPQTAPYLTDKLIAIGISTGGPPALAGMFMNLTTPLPPIVIVQHMPPHFTKSLASRLNGLGLIRCKEAETGDVLQPNTAYLAPGGHHLKIQKNVRGGKLLVCDGDPVSGHRPSVDVMMQSAAEVYGRRAIGVIMTGMGRDGSDGCRAIRTAGGYVLGQDEATSDVYGMNRVAFIEGNVDRQFGLDDAAEVIQSQVKKLWAPQKVGV